MNFEHGEGRMPSGAKKEGSTQVTHEEQIKKNTAYEQAPHWRNDLDRSRHPGMAAGADSGKWIDCIAQRPVSQEVP